MTFYKFGDAYERSRRYTRSVFHSDDESSRVKSPSILPRAKHEKSSPAGCQPDLERERVINEEEEEERRIGAVTVIYSRRINIYAKASFS